MSQLDWRGHDGKPQQRAWWEWISRRTRDGLGWISESQSFPGLSCSIETDGWDRDPWLLGHTTKWLRGCSQRERSPENWLPVAYKLMAFNAWLAPETWLYEVSQETQPDSVIADFGRLGNEFLAARPDMDLPYILPDGSGVLWFSSTDAKRGILFPFKHMRLVEGVTGHAILDTIPMVTHRAFPWKTLVVEGDALLESFGLPTPPSQDDRLTGPSDGLSGSDPVDAKAMSPEHPPVLTFHPIPGRIKETPWNADSPIWKSGPGGESIPWPMEGNARAFFAAARRVILPVEGHVPAAGIQTVTPGVEFVIDTGFTKV